LILVTGGAGFIGSNLVAALGRSGQRVAVCDSLGQGEKWRNLRKHTVEEFVQPHECVPWLRARGQVVEGVVHMGAITATTETDVDALLSTNFRFSTELWQHCAREGLRFVYASSAATYGDGAQGFDDDLRPEYLARLRPLNPYGWSKHLFDQYVSATLARSEAAPPLWAGLKFFNVFGPNEYHKGSMMSVVTKSYEVVASGAAVRLFKSYREGIADGEQRRDFVYVDDCVAVVMWLLSGAGTSGLYNVGSGQARSFVDLVHELATACGRPPLIEFVEMPMEIRPNYQYWTQADLSRLRGVGFAAPMTSLEDGVHAYVSDYLSRGDCYR
jgi:ADP-L-glycero-D-manno-heptose 6-epimerase